MNKEQQMVLDFHQHFNLEWHNIPFSLIGERERQLRHSLIEEEHNELKEATESQILPHIAEELADLLYVVYGKDVCYGIDMEEVFKAVHESNMTKTGGMRGDGKLLKGEGYKEPDINSIIFKQIEAGIKD